MHTRPDGSGRASIELTPAGVAITQAWLDALSARCPPTTASRTGAPPGSAATTRSKTSADAPLRTGELPDCGGTPATVLITFTLDQLESRLGLRHHQPRRADHRPRGAAAGRRSRHHPRRARRHRRDPGLRPQPPGRLIRTTSGVWPPATADVPSRRATGPRPGHKPTTSSRGSTADPPTWTT